MTATDVLRPPVGRLDGHPDWARELDARLPIEPVVVLSGNVDDLHVVRDRRGPALVETRDVVRGCLLASGYHVVLRWHVVTGAEVLHETDAGVGTALLGDAAGRATPTAETLGALLRRVAEADVRAGLLVEGAHRLVADRADPAPLQRVHVLAVHLARAPRRARAGDTRPGLHNTVVWAVQRENDLPHWLVAAPGVRVVSVPAPSLGVRRNAGAVALLRMPGHELLSSAQQAAALDALAGATEGMPLAVLNEIGPLATDQRIPAAEPENAVRALRSGLQRSPWTEPAVVERIRTAPVTLNDRVLGQERAVRTVVDILSRAALGLSGAQSGGHGNRPQGVAFLAGPTGVGKTELAKQVAELVFGRADAMVRFDMSEFAAPHTEARLLGAPPGYVGHDAGGELTNAVRQDPFRLLLFDEIEKADPRILDKFLQILEDGRLTDGSGSTVHFGETMIVFTSNLGIYEVDDKDRRVAVVKPGEDYDIVEHRVLAAIRTAFTEGIGRPELLNRIGDNIVVFDFIKPGVARQLLGRALRQVEQRVAGRTAFRIRFDGQLERQLGEVVVEPQRLEFGGRSVGSVVESHVVNPLARFLLDADPGGYVVSGHRQDGTGHHLDVRREP